MIETEIRYFWKLASALRQAAERDDALALWEAADDLEVFAIHAAPPVAARAKGILAAARDAPRPQTTQQAACAKAAVLRTEQADQQHR